MSLTHVHTLDLESYKALRNDRIAEEENGNLFRFKNTTNPSLQALVQRNLKPILDSAASIAIGYGLDLLKTPPDEVAGFYTVAGLTLSPAAIQLLKDYHNKPSQQTKQAILKGFPALQSETDARKLLGAVVGKFESQLDLKLGYHIGESNERIR